jgi:hypothetical protein
MTVANPPAQAMGQTLAQQVYAPASASWSLTTALTKLDPANLTLAFTVPASGRVCMELGLDWAINAGTSAAPASCFLGWILHGTSTQIGQLESIGGTTINGGVSGHSTQRWYLTGLTPGPIQLDLAAGVNQAGAGVVAGLYIGTGLGALTTNPNAAVTITAFSY